MEYGCGGGGNFLHLYRLVLKRALVIVDHTELEFLWNKYARDRVYIETSINSGFRLDQAKWLEIYLNYNECT